jgi:transcriptional regulator with XRE-family HTH domain
MARKAPHPIDKIVGRNIRIQRVMKRLSQGKLADRIGVTFQQVQKYESGANRVGSSRLYEIASILGVPLTSFFEGSEGPQHPAAESLLDLVAEPQAVRLVQAFSKIADVQVRRSLVLLAEKIARFR